MKRNDTFFIAFTTSDIDYAKTEAATQYGRLGVKVWICRGEIRPELQKKSSEGKGE